MVTIKKPVTKKPLVKKQDGGTSNDDKGILTPNNRLKSRRVRSADVSSYGSDASVTRTKLNGDKVTKSYKTTNGFVPNSKKTKTVTDKEGNVKSTETSPIDVNKAARKTNRIVNNVGRNKNDSWSVMKKGGAVKKPLVKKQSGGATKKKETPFQEGVRKKDFKASDTSYVSKYNKNIYSDNQKVMADEAPKTTKGSKDYNKKLDDAYKKTYGFNNVASMALHKRDSESKWPTKESEYRSIPNKTLWWEKKGDKKKMGGATKKKC